MELQNFLPELGLASVFAYAVIKLYKDMRADSLRRETGMKAEHKDRLSESKKREERLMEHLDKQAEINEKVSTTLNHIHGRLCRIEGGCNTDAN